MTISIIYFFLFILVSILGVLHQILLRVFIKNCEMDINYRDIINTSQWKKINRLFFSYSRDNKKFRVLKRLGIRNNLINYLYILLNFFYFLLFLLTAYIIFFGDKI